MDTNKNDTSSTKTGLESLSQNELINKYKTLLNIAKKAKQAKDEFAAENRLLKEQLQLNETQKEADKNALLTMKETLEQFTEQKLQLSTKLDEMRQQNQQLQQKEKLITELQIENESLQRQMVSLTNENETLLNDIDSMENQLKKVNLIGIEQKKHLELLELEVNRLKERESLTSSLEQRLNDSLADNKALKVQLQDVNNSLTELKEKYNFMKEINSQQRHKFNTLKERFVDVLGKLRKLKECKRILLETQEEYAESVSKWQNEIILAAQQLCKQLHNLKIENEQLMKQLEGGKTTKGQEEFNGINLDTIANNLNELNALVNKALEEHCVLLANNKIQNQNLNENENIIQSSEETATENLKQTQNYEKLETEFNNYKAETLQFIENLKLEQKNELKRFEDLIEKHSLKENEMNNLLAQKTELENQLEKMKHDFENQSSQLVEEKVSENLKYDFKELQTRFDLKEQEYAELQMEKSEIESKNQYLTEKLENYTEKCNQLELVQQTLEELTKTNEVNTKDLQKYQKLYEELQTKHELKEREHQDLLSEMRELNEALKKRGDLISRQEVQQNELNSELKRLQQIENLLIEKEKVIQQKDDVLNQIKEEIKISQTRVKELEIACARSEEQVKLITDELQNLKQNENNLDTSDTISIASNISRTEEVNRLREVDESLDERYTKLRTFAVKLKKKLQEQTQYTKELEQKLKDQEDDTKVENLKTKDLQKLNESLMAENKKIKASRKQTNVLNLEIEAAEKSLNEVSSKLTAKNNELIELNSVLETKETTIVQLRKEIAILEAAKTSEVEHAKELKTQIDLLQKQIKDALHSKQQMNEANKDLEHSQERLKLEIEDLRLQLTKNEKSQSEEQANLKLENSQLNAKLAELETTLLTTQTTLKTTENALENLRVEHLEYKIKAQAVLRQNQTKDTTQERELEAELMAIRQKAQELTMDIEKLTQTIEESDKEIEILNENNKQQQQRNQELIKIIEDLKLQNEILNREQNNLQQQQQNTLQQHRQQLENIEEYHKEKLLNIEKNYQQQIEQLKLELNKITTTRQPPIIGAVAAAKQSPEQIIHNDLTLLEREAAEGSEATNVVTLSSLAAAKRKISNASSTTRRSQHDFMPLDELLNVPMNAVTAETLLNTNNNFVSGGDVNESLATNPVDNTELLVAKEKLHIQECRLRHLTALLAENEQDLAKLTQMNDMLKEELRRQERSVEREQHMHNSEYLKNVIVKFLTLNSIDEKTRLVPVLNTILKLSPTEAEMLNTVAKGQKVAESNPRSWSNFLPSWGGSGGN